MRLSVNVNKQDLARVDTMLKGIRNGSKLALLRATKKTIKTMTVESAKRVGKTGRQMNLNASRIKQDFSKLDPRINYLVGYLSCNYSGGPNLATFTGTKAKLNGVSAKPMVSEKRYLVPYAFLAKPKKKNKDGSEPSKIWFRREYTEKPGYKPISKKIKGGFLEKKKRLPIRALPGPPVFNIFRKPHILDPITVQSAFLGQKNLDLEADEILRRYKAGYL